MILPPGGFFMLGAVLLFFNWLKQRKLKPRAKPAGKGAVA